MLSFSIVVALLLSQQVCCLRSQMHRVKTLQSFRFCCRADMRLRTRVLAIPDFKNFDGESNNIDDDLDLPKYIQTTNKVLVEVVKSLLSVVYQDRSYARYAFIIIEVYRNFLILNYVDLGLLHWKLLHVFLIFHTLLCCICMKPWDYSVRRST